MVVQRAQGEDSESESGGGEYECGDEGVEFRTQEVPSGNEPAAPPFYTPHQPTHVETCYHLQYVQVAGYHTDNHFELGSNTYTYDDFRAHGGSLHPQLVNHDEECAAAHILRRYGIDDYYLRPNTPNSMHVEHGSGSSSMVSSIVMTRGNTPDQSQAGHAIAYSGQQFDEHFEYAAALEISEDDEEEEGGH